MLGLLDMFRPLRLNALETLATPRVVSATLMLPEQRHSVGRWLPSVILCTGQTSLVGQA